jgi:urea transport system ATP-binding protein
MSSLSVTRGDEPQASYGRIKPDGLDTTHGAILYLDEVSVSFDGFMALKRLSLDMSVGELRCIIGPNGAGKTTMMDVITGKTRPTSGTAYFGQTMNLANMSESAIARAGIGRKFQRPTVFEQHTVFENLELALASIEGQNKGSSKSHGKGGGKGVWATLFARLSSEQGDRIATVLQQIRLNGHEQRAAGLLSHGQKQWLEIGMLLIMQPALILLDEPVAGMSDFETARTAELLHELRGKHSIMVVEHDMGFVAEIAGQGKVTVLHEGAVLAQGTMQQVQDDERVIEVYLGR